MSEELATNALNKVNELAEKLGVAEAVLEGGYAELADALLNVRENRYWEGQWESWGEYFKFVSEKHNLGRAQLYHKVAVVKELQGVIEPSVLSEIGISKSSVLADAHRASGGTGIPKELIARARDEKVTVKDLKKALAEATHAPEHEDMEWLDVNYAFYVTPEEKAEIQEAERAARGIDPPISTSIKDFMQRKEILLRFCREFLSTYSEPKEKEEEAPF